MRGPAALPRIRRSNTDEEAEPRRDRDAQDGFAVVHVAPGHRISMCGPTRPKVSYRGVTIRDAMEQPAFELDDEPAEPTFSVGEVTTLVGDAVRQAFPTQVWVRGEVQNLKRSANGHTYFSLVEKAGRGDRVQARLDCVLFRDDRRAVDRALADVPGAELGNDVDVRIRGRLAVYPAQGRIQLVMTAIDPVFTIGGIAANRERVLRALAAEGLLDRNARLALAAVPLRIGLITSDGSAAYHDFVHELETSLFAWRVVLADVRVQGAAAARRIAYSLRELARLDVDAVVVVRGGGSRADLAAFDTELVARGSRRCRCPCSSASGTRPTAAWPTKLRTPRARRRLRARRSWCNRWLVSWARSTPRPTASSRGRGRVRPLPRKSWMRQPGTYGVTRRPVRRCVPPARRTRHGRMQELGHRRTRDAAVMLRERERALVAIAARHLERATLRLDAGEVAVRALDPRRVLERGYTITRTSDGRVVRRARDVGAGVELVTELASGRVISRVEAVAEDTDE